MYKIDNEGSFNKYLDEHEKVCVKFSASWCYPCRVTGDNIRTIKTEDLDGWEFVEIDTDEPALDGVCEKYHISALPTLLYLKNKVELKRTIGLQTAQQITDLIKNISK